LREYRDEPVKAPPPRADEVLLWFSTPDGVLTAFDGRRSLIAVPADGITVPEGLRRKIDGRSMSFSRAPADVNKVVIAI
jgi:hypothetical protein